MATDPVAQRAEPRAVDALDRSPELKLAPGRAERPHRWRFHRAGGVDQVTLQDGADLAHLGALDPKLWVALAMPTRGVHIDPKTLAALDADKDGRIRMPEVVEAVRWATASLKSADELVRGGDRLALEAIADGALLAAAKRILVERGKAAATDIGLDELAETIRIFAERCFNGDGAVPVESAEDERTRQALADIIATHGGVVDLSGKPGVNAEKADAFFAEVAAFVAWERQRDGAAQTLGAAAAAADATRAVRGKIDDFFTRCRLAEVDARAVDALSGSEAELAALAMKDLSDASEVARLPLARIQPGRALPLVDGLNPAWTEAMRGFVAAAVVPVLGAARAQLSFDEWNMLKARLAPYEQWRTQKPITAVEQLGSERLQALAADGAQAAVAALIQRDRDAAAEASEIAAVEKLLLYRRDLFRVLNNFVNFSDFYGRRGAVFQVGTLLLDGRGCNLCLEVADAGRHSSLAALSGVYLAYCDCTRPGGEKLSIVAAFTDGDSDNLLVGRNGLFFDRRGRDWDATITKIVANPISLREAFWSPYKKVVRLIETQVAKRASKADTASGDRMAKTAEKVVQGVPEKPTPAAADDSVKIDVGTVAAIGVAIGGIGAMVTGLLSAFFGLGAWMPAGVIALLLLVSGPSMLLAYLKLRQRNLGPLLDANGWAINGRARINVPFGGALTDLARLPAGSERTIKDPYAEKQRPWRTYLLLFALVALALSWYLGRMDHYLPPRLQAQHVLDRGD